MSPSTTRVCRDGAHSLRWGIHPQLVPSFLLGAADGFRQIRLTVAGGIWVRPACSLDDETDVAGTGLAENRVFRIGAGRR